MQVKFHNSVLHFDKVMRLFKLYIQSLGNMSCPLHKSYTNWRIFFKRQSQQGYVQTPCYLCVGLRSRSHLKVKIDLKNVRHLNMYMNISEACTAVRSVSICVCDRSLNGELWLAKLPNVRGHSRTQMLTERTASICLKLKIYDVSQVRYSGQVS